MTHVTPDSQARHGPNALEARTAAMSHAATSRHGRIVTWRSIFLGLICVVGVCALTPYNDFVLSDTSLSAGYFPLAAVLILFALVVGVNAPLRKTAPGLALTTGELAVVMMMTLVACALPNWGLMRFLVPAPVAPFRIGVQDPQFWPAFLKLELPGWLFPAAQTIEGRNSEVVQWFFTGRPSDEAVPWRAWLRPALGWGTFALAMLLTLVALARLVLDQWMNNERLPFPLVQVQMALIESPPPGRALNDLFRSPLLWIGLGGVLFVHGLACLNTYYPKTFPRIPLGYDFTDIFGGTATSGQPLSYLQTKVKKAALSFIVIGLTYFIRSKVAFSLWGFYLIVNLVEVQRGVISGTEMPATAWQDQHLGACIAFVLGIFWIGRDHWKRVLRNAFGAGGGDDRYRLSFWAAVVGIGVMLGWLTVVGVHPYVAVLIVAFILCAHLIVSRVLAETGVPFYRSGIAASQVYSNFPVGWFSGRDIFFAGVFTVLGPLTTRDGMMGFALHGQGLVKQAGAEAADEAHARSDRRRAGGALVAAILVGFVVAGAATLYAQYTYPTPATDTEVPNRNRFGADYAYRRDMSNAFVRFSGGSFVPVPHSPALHLTTGFVVTGFLEFAALRWSSWPLLPVGYVASYGAFVANAWFSIFVGWLAKVLIVKYGGASLFQRARPLFVGIIFGEALAAGIWIVVNAIVVLNGGDIRNVKFLL